MIILINTPFKYANARGYVNVTQFGLLNFPFKFKFQ